mmetsp:Transcript_10722/g.27519  ORF Transcript_10722/g.27519 Transcript_10722/m.27519 type:complete len:222 (-) Transcript_10722:492-1157(-)
MNRPPSHRQARGSRQRRLRASGAWRRRRGQRRPWPAGARAGWLLPAAAPRNCAPGKTQTPGTPGRRPMRAPREPQHHRAAMPRGRSWAGGQAGALRPWRGRRVQRVASSPLPYGPQPLPASPPSCRPRRGPLDQRLPATGARQPVMSPGGLRSEGRWRPERQHWWDWPWRPAASSPTPPARRRRRDEARLARRRRLRSHVLAKSPRGQAHHAPRRRGPRRK